MAERNAYPKPSVQWGKNVLNNIEELTGRNYLGPVIEFVKNQKLTPKKQKTEFLKSSAHNIIFNSKNSMILNENILSSFFEKLATVMSLEQTGPTTGQKSSSTTSSKITTGYKPNNYNILDNQRLGSNKSDASFKNNVSNQRIIQTRINRSTI